MPSGREEEAEGGLVQPLGHRLATQGPLDPSGELEEKEILDRVTVEETAGREARKGVQEASLPGGVKKGGHLPEFKGLEGLARGGELAEEGLGVAHIDLTDITGP